MDPRATRSLLLAVAILAAPAVAGADPPNSAPPEAPSEARSEAWPTGREVAPARGRPPPDQAPIVACSFEDPVCVHAATAIHPAAILATLRSAERAFQTFRALGLPRPLPDGPLGGDDSYDIYLQRVGTPVTAIDLAPRAGAFDAASAFSVLPPPGVRAGCVSDSEVARGIGQAIVMRLDAGAETGAIAMASSYLAALAAPCSVVEIAAVDDAQRTPEVEITGGRLDALDGSLLFPWFLDDAYGAGRPAGVIAGLLAVSAQRTPPGSWQWHNEPDVFDALRVAAKDRGKALGELLLDFAVARAFVGSRSDGAHLSDVARFGALGRVRFEWSVPFASLPRRLAPLRPISGSAATYLWLDLQGAPADAELTFVADWELPVLFHWALVKVDPSGAEAGRVDVAAIYGSTHAERTVVGLGGLAGLLVVGVNGGDIDRAMPFDPDQVPFEPHAYTVTLAR